MYKVISIIEYAMTRNVEVENCKTGTIDRCFDQSALISDVNFEFLKLGNEYDCKIELFGNLDNVEWFYYLWTRKDLVQVNNVIHADLLRC